MNNYSKISELEHQMIKEAEANGGSVRLDLSNDLHFEFFLSLKGGLRHLAQVAPNYLHLAEAQRAAGKKGLARHSIDIPSNEYGLADSEYIESSSILSAGKTETQWIIRATSIATYAVSKCSKTMNISLYDMTSNRIIASNCRVFDSPDSDSRFVGNIEKYFPVNYPVGEHKYRARTYFETTGVSTEGDALILGSYVVSHIFTYNTNNDIESIKVIEPIPLNGQKRQGEDQKIVHIAYKREGIMPHPDYTHEIDLKSKIDKMPVWLPLEVEIQLRNEAYFYGDEETGYLSSKIAPTIRLSRFVDGRVVVGGEAALLIDWVDFAKKEIKVVSTKDNKATGLKLSFPREWKSNLSFDKLVDKTTDSDLYVMITFNTVNKTSTGYKKMETPILIYYHDIPPAETGTNEAHVPRLRYQWGCFDKNTLVLTPSGYRQACTLAIGDKVLSRHGKEITIRNIIFGKQETMLRITTENGSVSVTPGHTICSSQGHRPASDIVAGDKVLAWNREIQTEYFTSVASVKEEIYDDTSYNLVFDSPSEIIADGIFIGDYSLQQTVQLSNKTPDMEFPEKLHVIDEELRQLLKGNEPPAFVGADQPECLALHYFAVKALARYAGFPEEEAQRIAEFSQFIGDQATYSELFVKKIPTNINTAGLFCYTDGGYLVPIIPTAMLKWYDNDEVNKNDKPWFPSKPDDQRRYNVIDDILRPFHYYGSSAGEAVRFNPKDLKETLNEISHEVQKLRKEKKWPDQNLLMKMGVYIHLLADTRLHEEFSADRTLNNLGRLDTVLDPDGEVITTHKPYKDYPYGKLDEYPVGIQQIGAVVHDSHARFEYRAPFNDDELDELLYYSGHLTPVNCSRYARACHEILDFLLKCSADTHFDESTWNAIVKPHLIEAFEKSTGTFDNMKTEWEKLFSYDYHYNASALHLRLVTGNSKQTAEDSDLEKFEEFFQFTHLIYTIKQKKQSYEN